MAVITFRVAVFLFVCYLLTTTNGQKNVAVGKESELTSSTCSNCDLEKSTSKPATTATTDQGKSQKVGSAWSLSLGIKDSNWFPIPRSKILTRHHKSPYSKLLSSPAEVTKALNVFVPSKSFLELFSKFNGGIRHNNPKKLNATDALIEAEKGAKADEARERLPGSSETLTRSNLSKPHFSLIVFGMQNNRNVSSQPLRPNEGPLASPSSTESPPITTTVSTSTPSALQSARRAFATRGDEEAEESKNELLLEDNIKLARKYNRKSTDIERQSFRFTEENAVPQGQDSVSATKYPRYLLIRLRNKRNAKSTPSDSENESGSRALFVTNEEDEIGVPSNFKNIIRGLGSSVEADFLEEILRHGLKSYLSSNPSASKKIRNAEDQFTDKDVINEEEDPIINIENNRRFGSESFLSRTDRFDEDAEKYSRNEEDEDEDQFFDHLETKSKPVFDNPPKDYELVNPKTGKAITPSSNTRSSSSGTTKRQRMVPQRKDIGNGAFISVVRAPNLERERPLKDEAEREKPSKSKGNENGIWKRSMRELARGKTGSSSDRLTSPFGALQAFTSSLPTARGTTNSVQLQGAFPRTAPALSLIQYSSSIPRQTRAGGQAQPWQPTSGNGGGFTIGRSVNGNVRRLLQNSIPSSSPFTSFSNLGQSISPNGQGFSPAAFLLGTGNNGGGGQQALDLAQLLSQNLIGGGRNNNNAFDLIDISNPLQTQGLANSDLLSLAANAGGVIAGGTGIPAVDLATTLQGGAGLNPAVDLATTLQGAAGLNPAVDLATTLQGGAGLNPAVDLATTLQGGAGLNPAVDLATTLQGRSGLQSTADLAAILQGISTGFGGNALSRQGNGIESLNPAVDLAAALGGIGSLGGGINPLQLAAAMAKAGVTSGGNGGPDSRTLSLLQNLLGGGSGGGGNGNGNGGSNGGGNGGDNGGSANITSNPWAAMPWSASNPWAANPWASWAMPTPAPMMMMMGMGGD